MKRILTFFMSVVVAMSMLALPQENLSAKKTLTGVEKATVEHPLKAKVEKKHSEKLLVRDFVPAQVKEEKALAPVKKAAAKKPATKKTAAKKSTAKTAETAAPTAGRTAVITETTSRPGLIPSREKSRRNNRNK